MIEKTFYKLFIEINSDPSKGIKALQDKRLSHVEKQIINAFLLVRNNKNPEASQLLKSLPSSPLPFVQAMKSLILGISLNNQSLLIEAEANLLDAIPELKRLDSHYFQFMAYFNLFIIYLNTGSLVKAAPVLKELEKLDLQTDLQKLRLERCQLDFFIENNNFEQAYLVIERVKTKFNQLSESDIIPFLMSEFILSVKQEKYESCQSVLMEMKKFRKFHLSENFNFMKKMVDHLKDDAPIYINQETFASVPMLDHQIRVIKALEEQDLELAKVHWQKLMNMFPEIHCKDFSFTGDTCLFSLCLKKHANLFSRTIISHYQEGKAQTDILLEALIHSPVPLHKSYLYELLWGTPPENKEDFKKLSRLITKLRTDKGIDVGFKKGSYFVDAKKKQSAS